MLRLRYRLEVICFGALVWLAGFVPRRILRAVGSFGGLLGYLVDRRHRRITLDNLARALGDEYDAAGLRRVARDCWRHFGRITIDSFYFPRLTAESVSRLVDVEGRAYLMEAWARGKGVLIFSGHFGHWELAAIVNGFVGVPLALIARPLSNPGLERMLADLRSVSGNRIVYKRNAVRAAIKALREKMAVAIMIDQDARQQGVFVPFFGRLASTTPTLARMALRTGAPILPVSCVPIAGDRYRLVIGPEIEVRSDADPESEVLRVTAECTAILESWVRMRPELWLWMHRRWKTRPDSESRNPPDETPAEERRWA
jgi:KDO2-lipid IV(A) lauroyltransferase